MIRQPAHVECDEAQRPVVVFGDPNAAGRGFDRTRAPELRIDPGEDAFGRPRFAQRANATSIEVFEFVMDCALREARLAQIDE
jgi:hypothetical protein